MRSSSMVAVLQHGWYDAVATLAPQVEGLEGFLADGLADLSENDHLDEQHLLALVESAATFAASGATGVEPELVNRLRRTIYEYLLALDTLEFESELSEHPDAVEPDESVDFDHVAGPPQILIGMDEIAEPASPNLPADLGDEALPWSADTVIPDEGEEALPWSADTVIPEGDEALPWSADTVIPDDEEQPSWSVRARPDEVETSPFPPVVIGADEALAWSIASSEAEVTAEPPAESDWENLAIAPRAGFHISAEDELGVRAAADALADAADASERAPLGVALGAVPEIATQPEAEFSIVEYRHTIDTLLRRNRWDEAATTVHTLADELRRRDVAELAVETGDALVALDHRAAATACYLSASRADPAYGTPWTRLAEICVEDGDIGLAVSYLERAGRLARLDGDLAGAASVYRRMATLAPHRLDILELLVQTEAAAGRDPGD